MSTIYPPYIFGMHDRGGEHLMIEKGKRGWVLVTEELGADPNNHNGSNYTDLTNKNLGVIVRLNHGYETDGTIPHSSRYDDFARRCGNFVAASPGCHIWIIGNEMNLAWERPGGPNGQAITPQRYASCFKKCRSQIRSRTGHEDDQVVVGAVGPYNIQTTYPGNETGDFAKYLADILELLGDEVDGIALHAYTHGQDPNLVFSDAKMQDSRVKHLHNEFRVYRDFMAVIPPQLRDRPVYITETDEYEAWKDANTGWVRNAYKEINDWNQNPVNQPIQALILYRWIIGNDQDPRQVGWAIENKPGVQDDFRDAMNNEYAVVLPRIQPSHRVAWLEVEAPGRMDLGAEVKFSVKVRNDGRATWAKTGAQAVKLGYRWIDASGGTTEGERTALPSPADPGETVALPEVTVQAPDKPGFYTLELDLVEGADDWFADRSSPVWQSDPVRVGDRYRVDWLSVAAPSTGTAGERVTFSVQMRNNGALTWKPGGDHPFNLTYKWLDADREVVVADGLRTALTRDVAPGEEITLDARIQLPAQAGEYILMMDMVEEMVTWFHWKGSAPHETQVQIAPALPNYAAEWLDYSGPQRLQAGEVGTALIQVKNVGVQPWTETGAQAIELGYRWLDARGDVVPVTGTKTGKLPRTIQPGETAVFRDIELVSPQTPGAYRLVWDLMQNQNWLSSAGMAVMEIAFQITSTEYDAAWQMLQPWPRWMPPDEEQHTSLRLRNVGTAAWASGGKHPVHLAYHWFTEDGKLTEPWDTFRIPLPQSVDSGESVDLTDVAFKTPPLPGHYTLRWDLLREGEAWFFRKGGTPLEVPVEISDEALFVPWSAQASHNAADVDLAFDGDPATVWGSGTDQEPGMWFQVDLGEILVLDRVKVATPGRGFPVGYNVKLSEDGLNWRLVAEQKPNWRDVDVAFAPCAARYLRLEQTGKPDWPATWKISEIAVALAEPWAGAEASHYTGDADEAIDASLNTSWNTRAVKQKPSMWFKVDMGAIHQIERVVLEHPKNQQPRGYIVHVSTDDQDWQEIGRKDDNWGALDVEFPPVAARYIRVQTTNSSQYHPWGIAEFIIWRASPRWLRGRKN
ncbi:MAG: discoidin domain-containing protein [Anaerolineae bacterium]|jgi:hypothetical protein